MLLEIHFREFGSTTKLFSVPLKAHKSFSIFPFQDGKKENTELPNITDSNWINSWQLIDCVDKVKETVKIMLDDSTRQFIEEVADFYRPMKKDRESQFVFYIIDENYPIRDSGDTTEDVIEQIVHTFTIDASKCSFNMSNLTKNVSKTYQPLTLFEKVFAQYFYDYSATVNKNTYPMKGVKTILEDFFTANDVNYNNRFTTIR